MRRLPVLLLLLAGCMGAHRQSSDLTAAVREGNVAAVRALCAKGADPNAPSGGNGWPPLMHAVHKNQPGTAAALLDAGADVNRAGDGGWTPLMMAAGYGNRAMVALLLERGADAKLLDGEGAAAIDYALTGVMDIDDFTYFKCQNDTAALLESRSPAPRKSSSRWAHIKGCA